MKWPVSLVIITLNEEKNIQRCIRSAPQVSEIIVVDSQSQDKTAQMAQSLGAKVFQKEFLGFRDQKNYALSLASQPWILSLDADEELSSELEKEIDQVFLEKNQKEAYRIPRLSFYLGKWIRHGGWYPDYQTRLFKKEKAVWSGGEVHEHVKVNGDLGTLKNPLCHYVFNSLSHQIKTNNKYSSHGAMQLYKTGKRFSLIKLLFKPLGKFIECYVWKRGFLDGAVGLIIALGAAQSMFLKYAKLWELHDTNKESGST